MARIITALVGIIHLYFAYLEIFKWTDPLTAPKFGMTLQQAISSQTLAANQGFYNFMVAAGLLFSLSDRKYIHVTKFLLVFIVAVGFFGAATVAIKIFWLQSAPAIVALGVIIYSSKKAGVNAQ